VLHGGDLHYRSRVPAWLAEAAIAPLRRVAERGVPVLLLPGNHERSRLPYPLLAVHPHLHVFHAPRTVHLEARGLRVAFVGFPYAPGVRGRFRALLAEARRSEQRADVRLLCLHQCVEGATCGPGNFTFRDADDVVRRAELPGDVAAVLCGHVHRHQVLRAPGRPPVVYAGSIERTSFAEAGEPKGTVLVRLDAGGVAELAFRRLPVRPMLIRPLPLAGLSPAAGMALVQRVIEGTPADAVIQLRPDGPVPDGLAPLLAGPALRALAGARNVTVARARLAAGPARPPGP
jgi:DNA repair exonuclease SbcCD nuclease subunit